MDTTQSEQDTTQKPVDETPEVKETTPVSKETSPEQDPKTLTQADAERLVQLGKMDAGRKQKEAEVERDGFKAQTKDLTSQIEDSAEAIKKLETQVDDLTSEDPKRFDAIKELREARAERQTLKADRRTLEADKQALETEYKPDRETRHETTIFGIAAKYEGGDHVRLKELCDLTGATSEEQIVKVADTMWTKKSAETPSLKPFSGKTTGGTGDFVTISFDKNAPSSKEMISEGLRKK